MTWTKLDDTFLGDPKFMKTGGRMVRVDLAVVCEAVFLRALVYCNRHLTDGWIPTGSLPELCRGIEVDGAEVAGRLVDVGLWSAVDGGYQVTKFLTYQRSKKKILDDREANARRQRSFQAKLAAAQARTGAVPNGVIVAARTGKRRAS